MLKPLLITLLALALPLAAATQTLPLNKDQVQKNASAKVELRPGNPPYVSIRLSDPGWDSGLRLMPPAGQKHWDLSSGKILAADIENRSADKQLRLTMGVTSGSRETKDRAETNVGIGLNPGEKRTIRLLIPHRSIYAAPKGVPGPRVVDSDRVNSIDFYMQWPFESSRPDFVDCRVSNVRLIDAPDTVAHVEAANYFPFIDVYGQYAHGEWPEKIRADKDLKAAHAKELRELAADKRPSEWNRFGGWAKGPKLEATGHFRTQKHDGKWWLVDPEGNLFFSHGIDVLRPHTDGTPSKDRAHWFTFEPKSPSLDFNDWNLRKKYGKRDYDREFYSTLTKRLQHWGMNTIGNWGHSNLMILGKTPYTLQLSDFDRSLPRLAGGNLKFYDVFDPAYIEGMRNLFANAAARDPAIAKSINDPMCIGYFIDNEINYGNRGRQIFTDTVLKSPATQASKLELVSDLKAKYADISALNREWETSYADWDALLADTETVPVAKGYRTDSHAFFRKAVDQYFRLCRDAVKTTAPHRLYLGSRFISTDAVRKELYEASYKYCDVLTTNVYAHSVANFAGPDFPDMPVLIGEFHFGVRDRGMFTPGVVSAGIDQNDRAIAYTRFLQGALTHPNIVGTHWFQFRDQPLTGRWDGEGYQIGFVDVADTPYVELGRASRQTGEHMYRYRTQGKLVEFPR